MVPPSPPSPPSTREKRSTCSRSSSPVGLEVLGDRVEHRSRAAGPGLPLLPVRADAVEVGELEHPVGVRVQLVDHQRVVPVGERLQLVAEDHPVGGRRGVVHDDVGHRSAALLGARSSVRSIAITGVTPLPPTRNSIFGRRRVGQHEVALGEREPDDRAGLQAVDQVRGQQALGHRPDRDRDGPAVSRCRAVSSPSTTAT